METLFPELDFSIPSSHVFPLNGTPEGGEGSSAELDRGTSRCCNCLVQAEWLKTLTATNKRSVCTEGAPRHQTLTDREVQLMLSHPTETSATLLGKSWTMIELYYIPLSPASAIRRFPNSSVNGDGMERHQNGDAEESSFHRIMDVLRDTQASVLLRKYPKSLQSIMGPNPDFCTEIAGDAIASLCRSVLHCPFLDFSGSRTEHRTPSSSASNILHPLFVAAMIDHFVIALPVRPHTLLDALRFSASLLASDAAKYFILYQCIYAVSSLQQCGFFVGNVCLRDFVIRDDLWVELKPVRVLEELNRLEVEDGLKHKEAVSKDQGMEEAEICKISEWTTLWCLGKLSNYNYLLALNDAAGRCFGHPDYHPIMPWVVDFGSPIEGWRDLTKSKYRLTKGDSQLDLTYQSAESGMMIPHHIPETFSDLTFYIYNARRVPKSILCQHVRKRWVPAEYPSTMERLYQWSPDECIPEFYADPTIFKSIHSDLPDLGLPAWCRSVEEFLAYHRDSLESDRVSDDLHHWIDLNFGFKLSGPESVSAKNVVLSLHSKPKHMKNHGIQQLFTKPHPPKFRNQMGSLRQEIPLKRSRSVKKEKSLVVRGGGSGDISDESALDEMDDVSLSSLDFSTPSSVLEDLESLEALIDFSVAVDKDGPKLLEDFVSTQKKIDSIHDFFQKDLHAVVCLAVEMFSLSSGSSHWPVFSTTSKRMVYIRKMFMTIEHLLPVDLAASIRRLLSSKILPYSALQLIGGYERLIPFPGYLANLHMYTMDLFNEGNVELLTDILEDLESEEFSLLENFLKQLLDHSDRFKWATLIFDPVVKYSGDIRTADSLLPMLQRLYSESPSLSSGHHRTYVALLQPEFLNTMIIRLGLKSFLTHLSVPMIEKLTDLEQVGHRPLGLSQTRTDGLLNEEHIFPIDSADSDFLGVTKDHSLMYGFMEKESVQYHILAGLIWLAEKIGPGLTAKFISGNLLKSLSLCYSEPEKLRILQCDPLDMEQDIQRRIVLGDLAAWGVCEALLDIASLYGRCFIWDQYFSYCAKLVKDASRRLTPMNEAGLLGCMEMMQQVLPQVTELDLMEHLPSQIIAEILFPVVEIMTSVDYMFPSGMATRRLLTTKWLNLVYLLALRIGRDSARSLITTPLLVTFFGIFTKLYGTTSPPVHQSSAVGIPVPRRSQSADTLDDDSHGSPFINIKKDMDSGELTIGTPVILRLDSRPDSPHVVAHNPVDPGEILKELKAVFTEALAYDAYVPFCKLLGQFHMDEKLVNHDFLHEMCVGNGMVLTSQDSRAMHIPKAQKSRHNSAASRSSQKFGDGMDGEEGASNSIGSGGGLKSISRTVSANRVLEMDGIGDEEKMSLDSRTRYEYSHGDRTLRGNWLAYWQHELGQNRQEEPWNTKQIPLQTFSAHSGAVKSLYVFDSEGSFMSGSKDRTVRLWSIRNCGDGSVVSQTDGHYLDHKKAVTELQFLSRERLAASCDGLVNVWDPWTLTTVSRLEVAGQATCMHTSVAPNSTLIIGHLTDDTCFVSRYDVRSKLGPCPGGQFRVSSSTVGLIRCLVVSPDNSWFACGFSSGVISVFDQRTGIMNATWRSYESDLLQLLAITSSVLISIGNDNIIAVWDLKRDPDERLLFSIRAFSDPILHCSFSQGDLVALLGNNKIGVVGDVLKGGMSTVVTKIRGDAVKGSCLTMALLPLNRQLLVGGESGTCLLLC